MPINEDYFEKVPGTDSIEEWALSVGLTLEDALDAGVTSPDDDEACVYVPVSLLRKLDTKTKD